MTWSIILILVILAGIITYLDVILNSKPPGSTETDLKGSKQKEEDNDWTI
jgi:hypothetical protein